MSEARTHYEILQVSAKAGPTVIRAAYKVLAQEYHPDKGHAEIADAKMKRINEAYAVLSDDRQRQAYDAMLREELQKLRDQIEQSAIYKSRNGSRSAGSRGACAPRLSPTLLDHVLVRMHRMLGSRKVQAALALMFLVAAGLGAASLGLREHQPRSNDQVLDDLARDWAATAAPQTTKETFTEWLRLNAPHAVPAFYGGIDRPRHDAKHNGYYEPGELSENEKKKFEKFQSESPRTKLDVELYRLRNDTRINEQIRAKAARLEKLGMPYPVAFRLALEESE